MCLTPAYNLFKKLNNYVMRSNMNFFNKTPSGRIINRFTDDMSKVDFSLPWNFYIFVSFGVACIVYSIGVIILFFWMSIFIVIAWAMVYRLQNYFRNSKREL